MADTGQLDSEQVISHVCATIENQCGTVRGIGPAVREAVGPLLADRDRLAEQLEQLRAAIDDYCLWEPGRAGHAAAHRKLMEARRG